MIGITFELRREYDSFLSKIFSGLEIDKYVWTISDEEILHMDASGDIVSALFESETMEGPSFRKCIEMDQYLLIFADIKAFRPGEATADVSTFDDFVNSACQLALFCTDVTNIEVYCKSETMLRTIIQNCKQFGFSNVEVLTLDDRIRTSFRVVPD